MYLFDDVMLECGWYVYLHLVLIFCFYNLSIVNHGYVLCTNLSNKWISLWNTYYLSLKVRKFEKQIIWSSFRSKFRKNFVRLFFGKYKYRLRLDRLLLNFPNLHTDVWDSPKKFYNKTFITSGVFLTFVSLPNSHLTLPLDLAGLHLAEGWAFYLHGLWN